jgi:hypothetical protein
VSLKKELKKAFIPWKNWLKVQSFYLLAKPKVNSNDDMHIQIVASITSYPARFSSLHLTLKSLIQQSEPADKILLWIAYEDEKQLPSNVLRLQQSGLIEIRPTKDTRSYKKIIPSLAEFPEAAIVTFDDDVFYPCDALSKLIALHRQYPSNVIANRTHCITLNETGEIQPYKQWKKNASNAQKPEANFQTGIGGVLYPPNSLAEQVMEESLFTKLAAHGDDIWLYWMMRLNGNFVIQTDNNYHFYHWPFSQKTALYKQNVRKDGNDIQIQAMLDYFGSPLDMPINRD